MHRSKGIIASVLLPALGTLLALLLPRPACGRAITHHDIRAALDPSRAWIEVTDVTRVHLSDARARRGELHLLLHRSLEVTDATPSVRGASWQVFPSVDAGAVSPPPDSLETILLDRAQEILLTPPAGESWPMEFTVSFAYRGVIYDSLKTPATPYARSFAESPGLIDTAGTYLAGSSLWLPSELRDLFTFDLEVTLPPSWRSMSQGEPAPPPAEAEPAAESRREKWSCPQPMTEAYLVAGPYLVEEGRAGETAYYCYLYHPDISLCARYREATERYLARYAERIGPYPFAKFALVENFWQTGYGMPSFTLLGDRVIRLPFIIDTSYGHEILHNWWGNGVFVDPHGGNWCEGLTTFGADYSFKEEKNPAEAREYRRSVLVDYVNYVREGKDFPLARFTGRTDPATQNVGYGKSMMVFQMIRERLGREKFTAALQAFYRRNLFHQAGWEDLMAAFGEASGEKLGWLLDQWVRRPGAPALRLEDVALAPPGVDAATGPYRVKAAVRQAEPAFRLQVPVVVRGETADTTFTVELTGKEKAIAVEVPWRPVSIAVDPDFEIFRRVDRREIPAALSQTLGADSTVIVLPREGAEELRAAYRALAESWTEGNPKARLVTDGEVTGPELAGCAVWLLGESSFGREFLEGLPQGTRIARGEWILGEERYPADGHSLVLTAARAENPDFSWTWLLSQDTAALAEIGKKLPHYGKYTYLVFEGARNVGKGILEPTGSPLEVAF